MIVLTFAKSTDLLDLELDYLNTLEFHLFANDETPTGDSVTGDFDDPVDSGYTPLVIDTWGASVLNGSNQAETTADAWVTTFDHDNGDITIYGYFVTDPADGDALVWAERADDPFTMDAPGQTYTVQPKKVMQSIQ